MSSEDFSSSHDDHPEEKQILVSEEEFLSEYIGKNAHVTPIEHSETEIQKNPFDDEPNILGSEPVDIFSMSNVNLLSVNEPTIGLPEHKRFPYISLSRPPPSVVSTEENKTHPQINSTESVRTTSISYPGTPQHLENIRSQDTNVGIKLMDINSHYTGKEFKNIEKSLRRSIVSFCKAQKKNGYTDAPEEFVEHILTGNYMRRGTGKAKRIDRIESLNELAYNLLNARIIQKALKCKLDKKSHKQWDTHRNLYENAYKEALKKIDKIINSLQ